MAYKSNFKEEELLVVNEETSSPIVVKLLTDKDDESIVQVDIRRAWRPDGGDNLAPTQKGVRIDGENIVEILSAVFNALPEDMQESFRESIDED